MKRNQFTPLFCDLYHLTMAQAMFEQGTHNKIETYEMFIRKTPFQGSYLIAAGLPEVLQWINDWHFSKEDIEFLKTQEFNPQFLHMLETTPLSIDMDAFPEGEIVFPNEPIVRVTGPAWQAVLLETGILNIINAQSLFATKASRIVEAASCDGKKRTILEMGLRRAQDTQGFTPTRASYIGGIDATSNVEAGKFYNIPVAGTMAHCFIMRYKNEVDAFKTYMKAFPNNASLLIDTYDTIQGAKNAVKASKETGIPLKSVRLDSGDLAYLSKQVRKILDEGDCKDTKITVSNDLDEYTIQSLILEQKAPIDIFGVGTMLATSYDQPALGGVYKLKQTQEGPVIKVSENKIKTTIPGATDVLRLININTGQFIGDIIHENKKTYLNKDSLNQNITSIQINNETIRSFTKGTRAYRPIINVIKNGVVNNIEMNKPLNEIRKLTLQNLNKLDVSHKRLKFPHTYVAGLEENLFITRNNLRNAALNTGGREYGN